MGPRYMGFGSDSFRGAPVKLTNPTTGSIAAALAVRYPESGGPRLAGAYRVLAAGSVTVTDSSAGTETWTHVAGEGYAFPLKDIVFTGDVLVFV